MPKKKGRKTNKRTRSSSRTTRTKNFCELSDNSGNEGQIDDNNPEQFHVEVVNVDQKRRRLDSEENQDDNGSEQDFDDSILSIEADADNDFQDGSLNKTSNATPNCSFSNSSNHQEVDSQINFKVKSLITKLDQKDNKLPSTEEEWKKFFREKNTLDCARRCDEKNTSAKEISK